MASFLSTNGAGIATDPAKIPTKINKSDVQQRSDAEDAIEWIPIQDRTNKAED